MKVPKEVRNTDVPDRLFPTSERVLLSLEHLRLRLGGNQP